MDEHLSMEKQATKGISSGGAGNIESSIESLFDGARELDEVQTSIHQPVHMHSSRPLRRPFGAYMYLVPDQSAQQQLAERGCHPRARKGYNEYGGLHFSIDLHGPADPHRLEITSEADWTAALDRVRVAATGVSQREWRAFLINAHVRYYDSEMRQIRNSNMQACALHFGGENPLQAFGIDVRQRFSLYGTHHEKQYSDGPLGLLANRQAAELVCRVARAQPVWWLRV